MRFVDPYHPALQDLMAVPRFLLYLLRHLMLGEARLAFLTICCIILVACNWAGQTTVGQKTITKIEATLTPTPSIEMSAPRTTNPKEEENLAATPATLTTTPTTTVSPTSSPTAAPTELLCWEEGGRIELGEMDSELLPDPLSYRVYLPPCYDELPERRYPVLYMIHGQSSTDDQWERLGVGDVIDEFVAEGSLPPMMVVMPRDRVWKEPTEDNFGRSVAEELVPWIDGVYRTQPGREHRAVGGLSRGGAWALHLGLEYWKLFGSIGAHSGFIFHTDTYLVNGWLDEIPFEQLPRIFMDAPDKDRPPILQSALWFEGLLTQRGIPHEWHIYSGYHEEAYWQAHVEDYLRWYTQEWEMGTR